MAVAKVSDAVRTSQFAASLISMTLVVAILIWAQVVLIPFALAVLLTFVLSPVVTRLDRMGLQRVPAVLVSVSAAGILLLGVLFVVGIQLQGLVEQLPSYQDNIRQKISAIRNNGTGETVAKLRNTFQQVTQQDPESAAPVDSVEPVEEGNDSLPDAVKPGKNSGTTPTGEKSGLKSTDRKSPAKAARSTTSPASGKAASTTVVVVPSDKSSAAGNASSDSSDSEEADRSTSGMLRSLFARSMDGIWPSNSQSNDKSQADKAVDPMLVRVVPEEDPDQAISNAWDALLTLTPMMEALATGGFSLILVIFMLIQREDMRNRLVSFISESSVAMTTKALDDAGSRISRYLGMQLIVNGSFGIAVGLGLLAIGVPYALLWGLCAAVFRYVPYIGPWVAAVLPIVVSAITLPGWMPTALVIALFLVLELISNNVIEPLLYGNGIGISPVALLVSAAFWTWIWGPVGLILATPLTVCLLVLGKYVPSLRFLDRLLGDRPALPPHVVLLQRILAKDSLEATSVARDYRSSNSLEATFDDVLVPALLLARQERTTGAMSAAEEAYLLETVDSILNKLSEPEEAAATAKQEAARAKEHAEKSTLNKSGERVSADSDAGKEAGANSSSSTHNGSRLGRLSRGATGKRGGVKAADVSVNGRHTSRPLSPATGVPLVAASQTAASGLTGPRVKIMGSPAHQEAEEVTLRMLDAMVHPAGLDMEVLSMRTLPSQIVEQVGRDKPRVFIIASLPPGGLPQALYLCRLLRKKFPDLGIVVGCWGFKGSLDKTITKFRSAGAHYVTTTLLGAREHAVSLSRTPVKEPDASELVTA